MTKIKKTLSLKVGDLVCLYRRRSKGMGIVTEYCDDVSVLMDADAETVMEIYREYSIKDWRRRDEFKQTMCSRSDNPDLIFDFFLYNTAFKGKLKKRFAFVRWSKRPSTYQADAVYSSSGWFPAEWLKAY
jgi:hypothetical protein